MKRGFGIWNGKSPPSAERRRSAWLPGRARGRCASIRATSKASSVFLDTESPKAPNRPKSALRPGLAWTHNGGELLLTEIGLMSGTGQLTLTGKLGEVLQESARAAVSYVRSKAETLDLPRDFYKKQDIHIHVPEGAIPKDGPSAGVTMVIALISALSGRKVRKSICMTGEITLRGKILPVGGIKEKILAAHQADCKTVFLPVENERDLQEYLPPSGGPWIFGWSITWMRYSLSR